MVQGARTTAQHRKLEYVGRFELERRIVSLWPKVHEHFWETISCASHETSKNAIHISLTRCQVEVETAA
jgi:hypothetical protein